MVSVLPKQRCICGHHQKWHTRMKLHRRVFVLLRKTRRTPWTKNRDLAKSEWTQQNTSESDEGGVDFARLYPNIWNWSKSGKQFCNSVCHSCSECSFWGNSQPYCGSHWSCWQKWTQVKEGFTHVGCFIWVSFSKPKHFLKMLLFELIFAFWFRFLACVSHLHNHTRAQHFIVLCTKWWKYQMQAKPKIRVWRDTCWKWKLLRTSWNIQIWQTNFAKKNPQSFELGACGNFSFSESLFVNTLVHCSSCFVRPNWPY